MADEKKGGILGVLDTVKDITNPTVEVIIEFDPPSLLMLGTTLLIVFVLIIIAWAIARAKTNP